MPVHPDQVVQQARVATEVAAGFKGDFYLFQPPEKVVDLQQLPCRGRHFEAFWVQINLGFHATVRTADTQAVAFERRRKVEGIGKHSPCLESDGGHVRILNINFRVKNAGIRAVTGVLAAVADPGIAVMFGLMLEVPVQKQVV